jgi:CheY-like chemotaxis protein/HPt (histidine-containing phosphotransfer) domain-containing protein
MQALQLLGRESFDLVLMDVHMPVIDGIEATRALRRDPALERLPVVGLSASVQLEDRARALAAGMNAFIGKPIVPADLFAALEKWARRSAAERETTADDGARQDQDDARLVANLRTDPALDVAHAVDMLLGREDLYARLVRRVVDKGVCSGEVLRTALRGERLDEAALVAHNLGSNVGSLGAASLRQQCLAVEAKLRGGLMDVIEIEQLAEQLDVLGERLRRAVGSSAA